MSVVLSAFSAFPLGLVMVMYGKKRGLLVMAVTFIFSLFISLYVAQSFFLVGTIVMASIIAVICYETVTKNYDPIKTIAIAGTGIIFLVTGLFFSVVESQNINVKEVIVTEITKQKTEMEKVLKEGNEQVESKPESLNLQAYLEQPEIAADAIIKEFPGYFMMSVFLILWVNLGLLSRSRMISLHLLGQNKAVTQTNLFAVKLPDQLVMLVAVALGLAAFGDQISETYVTVGITLLKVLGVFYFFQGFSIYLAFLNFAKIIGFFRTVLVVLTVFTAGQVLAIAGLLDTFFNFRKFLNKKN
jgi:predicted signal transduction protein with EAL and GGDEF domain